MPSYGTQNFVQSLTEGDSVFVFGIPTDVALSASPNGAVRVNGVVTFTTGVAHNFVPGMYLTAKGVGSVNGTQLGGLYLILTVPSTTTLTCKPLTPGPFGTGNTNQANDTGGGGSVNSIAGETPTTPQQSISISLANKDTSTDTDVSLEIFFTGAPGAFEVDLMEADTDTSVAYQIASGGTAKLTTVSANNTGRIDATNIVARFVAVNVASRANSVGIVARLSRQ